MINQEMIKRHLYSISGQFILIAFLASFLLVLNVLYDNNRTLNAALLENVKTSISQTSQLLNLTTSTHASKEDLNTVKIYFSEMIDAKAKNGLTYVVVGDSKNQVLITTRKDNENLPIPNADKELHKAAKSGVIHVRNRLLLPGSEIGFLQYGFSTENIIEATANQHRNSLLRTLFVISLTFYAIIQIGSRTTKRFKTMLNASDCIVKGDLSQRVEIGGFDELTKIAQQFNSVVDSLEVKIAETTDLNRSLEARVDIRTAELENSNKQLENSLTQLKEAQRQLVHAEKLASLGSLVAGIAHELNTPIGNAYMVSTTVLEKVTEFESEFKLGTMKRSSLMRFKLEMSEAADLLNRNLVRATELITSFKTVAVDQSSENQRRFNLMKTIEELAVTLRVQLRKSRIDFSLNIPADIELDSYPGPLMQVIANLFNNAIIHGFENRKEGKISIVANLSEEIQDHIEIHFLDNGNGIEPRIVDKVFDPFFTTKLGQGGSGLGLHICYNIVHGILEGQIQVHSLVDVGTRFTLILPLRVSALLHDEENLAYVPDSPPQVD